MPIGTKNLINTLVIAYDGLAIVVGIEFTRTTFMTDRLRLCTGYEYIIVTCLLVEKDLLHTPGRQS